MRWPLRHQILLPMAAIMLLTVATVGGIGAVLAVGWTERRIESQLDEVARIVEQTNFPLTDAVLGQMRALSGAELVLVDAGGSIVSSSSAKVLFERLVNQGVIQTPSISMGNRMWAKHGGYFHTVVPLAQRKGDPGPGTLHILYPEEEYRRAWQYSVYPTVAFVLIALPVMLLLAMATASQISHRVGRLQGHVDRIASGDFRAMDLPRRDDELRSLSKAVNHMAARLANYEEEVRSTERVRTLAHLGGGIAHQLRNSATGCLMALDIHSRECSGGTDSESLAVAKRQLELMEKYVQRFLRLGKAEEESARTPVDLAPLVQDLMPLVHPAARHAGVELRFERSDSSAHVMGNADQLSQLIVNLLINAIEAAAESKVRSNVSASVLVAVERTPPDHVMLTVADSGDGPPGEVQAELFKPFVTGKPDGVGLGLSMAQEIVAGHGGSIGWSRREGMTQFRVMFPCQTMENCSVASNGR